MSYIKRSELDPKYEKSLLLEEYKSMGHIIGGNYEENDEENDEDNTPRPVPYMNPSRMELYTIPEGTILYHGSTKKETFNPYNIKLGNDNLVAFFSPNRDFALDYIQNCSEYPSKNGYVHVFKVNRPIDNIRILSPLELGDNFNSKEIENKFCSRDHDPLLNGIGIFFPKDGVRYDNVSKMFDLEIALCNVSPKEISYIGSHRCLYKRKLNKIPYNFANGVSL